MSLNVVIVGAPRSGTNMLRDVLTSAPGITTWPCDEVNLLWKHGNLDVSSDEIPLTGARPEVAAYIRRAFARRARAGRAEVVVEKTCATSLRVPFVRAVLPHAKFVFIRRDGIDAAASTMRRWNAPFDWAYTARKARFVPPSDIPRHLVPFVTRRVRQRLTGDAGSEANDLQVSTWWGPKPSDHRELMAGHPLEELAFIQWQRCVEQSAAGLTGLGPDQVMEVVYEEFVRAPREHVQQILEFIGQSRLIDRVAFADVSASSVGKGRGEMGDDAVDRLEAIGSTTLHRFGYA